MKPAIEVKRRFRKFVEVDSKMGCWKWTGCLCKGYGVFTVDGKKFYAHRFCWMLRHCQIPKGWDLHHHVCGNRSCVRPAHCRPLPHAAHMKLHARRGAWNGSRNSQAVRTETDVLVIRFLAEYLPFLPVALIAKHTGTPLRSVYWILNGGGWNHIQLPSREELQCEFEEAEAMREAA